MDMEEDKKRKIKEVLLASEPEKSRTTKIFGSNNSLGLDGDAASLVIGGIVEKGISETSHDVRVTATPPPQPTVLPFPVARHRSHGPHWNPVARTGIGSVDDEMLEEEDSVGFEPPPAFAKPVKRKPKKALNLMKWRDVLSSDGSCGSDKAEGNSLRMKKMPGEELKKRLICGGGGLREKGCPERSLLGGPSLEMDTESCSSSADMEVEVSPQPQVQCDGLRGASGVISNSQLDEMDLASGEMGNVYERKDLDRISGSSWQNSGNGGSMSLQSEIDVENHLRLKSMAPKEIAEAQAEIMEKMGPSLLNFLKKRGTKKMNISKPGSDLGNGARTDNSIDDQGAKKQLEKVQSSKYQNGNHSSMDSSLRTTTKTTAGEEDGPKSSTVSNLDSGTANLWNAWSQRVEAVRDLRFSLEGAVIANEPEAGHMALKHGLTADNVAERDFLRTEGDPAAAGYTIREAVQLSRSVIPGQRSLALHLIASLLDRAVYSIQQNKVGSSLANAEQVTQSVDWEAVWAYALGPEPELVLALRICLDDNHNSVVLSCVKVIQSVLTCNLNENYFQISEKMGSYEKDIFTAPVFRAKPEIDAGFIPGGFWKYSAKPSTILNLSEEISDDEVEGKHTIQEDIVIASQDFAAGLVRMGMLPRLRFLLESNPFASLEECIISILVAIARHSPTCADAILKCQRLVHTIVHRFTMGGNGDHYTYKINSVRLLKVLAKFDKTSCMEFINNGSFQSVTWHLFQPFSSLDQWIQLGKESCKLSSALMVEQLRFWKVCINYGCCLSYYPTIFPALCLWLMQPKFDELLENDVLCEFASISAEAFSVLEALSRKLPILHTQQHLTNEADDEVETWSWNYVSPVVELALTWIASKSDPFVCKIFGGQKRNATDCIFHDVSACSLLWVYSFVMHMLSTLLERVKPEDNTSVQEMDNRVPWLPEFVPKVGLEVINHGFLGFPSASGIEEGEKFARSSSFTEVLCCFRQQGENETSLASSCCLHGLLRTVTTIDNLIKLAKNEIHPPLARYNSSWVGKLLEDGIQRGSVLELRNVLNLFTELVSSEWSLLQSIESFGRGGPAPGVGVGWGASGGGFWSLDVLLVHKDVELLVHMLTSMWDFLDEEPDTREDKVSALRRLNSLFEVCLTCGPSDRITGGKALDMLLGVPILKQLGSCIQQYLQSTKCPKQVVSAFKEEDYVHISGMLSLHYSNRWLSLKRKLEPTVSRNSSASRISKKGHVPLTTIHEGIESSSGMNEENYSSSLATEWAHQRLPLPLHWLLSSVATISEDKHTVLKSASSVSDPMQVPSDVIEIAKSGLFFLLGSETMSYILSANTPSPVQRVPLVWKLHSLSVSLLVGMGVLEDEKARNVYEALQDLYGELLDRARSNMSAEHDSTEHDEFAECRRKHDADFMGFQSEIHESYTTFIEALVDQFSAISYGDLIFGRQVAIYLHRNTEAPVRLAAWNALSNARVLEILPLLEACLGERDGYLYPVEDNDNILEAYVKSWVSGALDRAVTRNSMAYTLVLHHVSSFIFAASADKKTLRNKLIKSLLRDYSEKQKHEGMLLDVLGYNNLPMSSPSDQAMEPLQSGSDIVTRIQVLAEACQGNASLLTVVEKLKSLLSRKRQMKSSH